MNANLDSEYVPGRSEQRYEGLDPVARGADAQPTNVDYAAEDREAARSEETGRISKSEVEELRAEAGELKQSRTRGVKNDAMKAERDLDKALEQEDPEILASE